MYTEMSPETADFIKMMFDRELFDVVAKPGRLPVATVQIFRDMDAHLSSQTSTEQPEMSMY